MADFILVVIADFKAYLDPDNPSFTGFVRGDRITDQSVISEIMATELVKYVQPIQADEEPS